MNAELLNNKLNIKYFLYEIVHHCNLNCKSCDHCAPLAKEEYVNIKLFEKDLKQMSKIFNVIYSIGIMGGEPLLHPNLTQILKSTRKILNKNTSIYLYTNGILLTSLPDKFWKAMHKYKIYLIITNYRLKIDYKKIIETAYKYNVFWSFEGTTGRQEKLFSKPTLDLTGNQDINISHSECWQGQVCATLENGHLYKCPTCSASRHFNEYFGTNLEIDIADSIDIYKTSKNDIINYFNNPIPFCKYCDMKHREENQKWDISKKILKNGLNLLK